MRFTTSSKGERKKKRKPKKEKKKEKEKGYALRSGMTVELSNKFLLGLVIVVSLPFSSSGVSALS
jgi:hypothetical protein